MCRASLGYPDLTRVLGIKPFRINDLRKASVMGTGALSGASPLLSSTCLLD
jgi:hypothetical protein